jgi:hypothetical protein
VSFIGFLHGLRGIQAPHDLSLAEAAHGAGEGRADIWRKRQPLAHLFTKLAALSSVLTA